MLSIIQRYLLIVLILISIFPSFTVSNAQKQQQQQQQVHDSCSIDPVSDEQYEWETWNYYEILGLEEPRLPSKTNQKRRNNRDKLQQKDVRKAYRKQAQLWHPDKIKQNNATESVQNSTQTKSTTIEESNARFARISEAYQVLNDPVKRNEYDNVLKACEEEQKQLHRQPSIASQWLSNVDPFKLFEELIFGSSADQEEKHQNGNQRQQKSHSSRTSSSSSSSSQNPTHNQKPVRVMDTQQVVLDRYSGREIHRALRIEEYAPNKSGQYYYRIIAQDFAELFDVYSGISLQPITQPYILEEGSRSQPPSSTTANDHTESQNKKRGEKSNGYSKQRQPQQLHHALFPGDLLTPDSPLLTSPNRRFYAGLSPDCELLIMADNSNRQYVDLDDELVWTSNTAIPQHGRGPDNMCYVTLKGSHLVVAMGGSPPDHLGTVLWYSPGDARHGTAYENGNMGDGSNIAYVVQLDCDGSLVVYSLRTVPLLGECKPDGSNNIQNDFWKRVSNITSRLFSDCHTPETKSGKAWVATRNWFLGLLLGRTIKSSPTSTTPYVTYRRCIYATGWIGCNRPGRRIVQLVSDVSFHSKNFYGKCDHLLDKVMELFLEKDEDDDILDILLRVLNNGMKYVKREGISLVRKSMKLVREKYVRFRS